MKTLFTIFCILVFISDSYPVPLNGTYTIGNGGNYPTINSAVSDVVSQGVNGPVVFNILSGFYNENVNIDSIQGTSIINTVTFKSQTGIPADVILENSLSLSNADNVSFESISFHGFGIWIYGMATNIRIEKNLFTNQRRSITIYSGSNFKIINNTFIPMAGPDIYYTYSIFAENCGSMLIEKNNFIITFHIEAIQLSNCNLFYITKNKIWGGGISNSFHFNSCGNPLFPSVISNNFFSVYTDDRNPSVINCNNLQFIYNSFYLGVNFFITASTDITLLNNLFITTRPVFNNNSNLSSDYNNFYNLGITYNGIHYNNVINFYNATGLDQHSNSHSVNFLNTTIDSIDLHLDGSSIGDEQLLGIPTALVTDDIDGQPRDPEYPYKGADEADVLLPVELSAFTSTVTGNNVLLNWTTSMESNNSGFDIERRDARGKTQDVWERIGNTIGNGTSSSPHSYEFFDIGLKPGKYHYRLKQIDFNGNFKYYELTNEVLIGIPEKFSLSQNYPNPFNPSTVISYSLTGNSFVSMKVFDVSGKEVAVLINEKKEAGIYSVTFDGSNLPSGIYLYTLKAEGYFADTKRMVLIK